MQTALGVGFDDLHLRVRSVRLRRSGGELRLRFSLARRVVGVVDPQDQITLLDVLILLHGHAGDLPSDARGDRDDVRLDHGIIRRLLAGRGHDINPDA
jgi:hypothetical protein